MFVVKKTRAMQLTLHDLMVNSVRSDLRAELGFKKAAWVEVLRMIVTEFLLQSILNHQKKKQKKNLFNRKKFKVMKNSLISN